MTVQEETPTRVRRLYNALQSRGPALNGLMSLSSALPWSPRVILMGALAAASVAPAVGHPSATGNGGAIGSGGAISSGSDGESQATGGATGTGGATQGAAPAVARQAVVAAP